jgi:hypothetical protein
MLAAWAAGTALYCLALDPLTRPLIADNQLYFYMAERAASGVPPHVSHVDSKSDLGVLLTAAAIDAGRAVGIDDVPSSRFISIAFTAASVALIAELGCTLGGSVVAGHAAAMSLLAVRAFTEHTAAGNNVKIFVVTFLLLAHVAMTRIRRGTAWSRNEIVAGLAAGAAFACWQPVLLVVAAVVLEGLVGRGGGPARAVRIAIAAAVPTVLCESYFAWHGVLAQQIYQVLVLPLASVHPPTRLLESLRFVLTEADPDEHRIVPAAAALFAIVLAVRALRSPRNALATLRSTPGALSVLAGGAGATLFTLYDHQGVPDLFFPDPYFALATGALVARIAGAKKGGGGESIAGAARTWIVVASVAVALVLQIRYDAAHRRPPAYTWQDQRRIADVVRIWHEQYGSVWAYGAVHLLGLAHLDNHVPYGLFYDDIRAETPFETYRPVARGLMPEIIVHTRGALPGGNGYLADGYVDITPPAFAEQLVMVWRRVAPQAAQADDWRRLGPPAELSPPTPLIRGGADWERPQLPARLRQLPVKSPAPPRTPLTKRQESLH